MAAKVSDQPSHYCQPVPYLAALGDPLVVVPSSVDVTYTIVLSSRWPRHYTQPRLATTEISNPRLRTRQRSPNIYRDRLHCRARALGYFKRLQIRCHKLGNSLSDGSLSP